MPRLKGKTLAVARKALRRAHCRVGKVRGKGRVVAQKPRPGKRLRNRARVNLVLGG